MKSILLTLLLIVYSLQSNSDSGNCLLLKVKIETKDEIKTRYINIISHTFINPDSINNAAYLTRMLKSLLETKDELILYPYILLVDLKLSKERVIYYIPHESDESINTSDIKSCKLVEQFNCSVGSEIISLLNQSDSEWINSEIISSKNFVNGVCDVTCLFYSEDKGALELYEKMQVALKKKSYSEYTNLLKECRNYKMIVMQQCSN